MNGLSSAWAAEGGRLEGRQLNGPYFRRFALVLTRFRRGEGSETCDLQNFRGD
jgi:hypothetical protein